MSNDMANAGTLKLDRHTRLDDAARQMQEAEVVNAQITDASGKVIGAIALDDIVNSMVEKVEVESTV